ncbi:MAG: FTR1 family protein [Thermoleophilia bacterium]
MRRLVVLLVSLAALAATGAAAAATEPWRAAGEAQAALGDAGKALIVDGPAAATAAVAEAEAAAAPLLPAVPAAAAAAIREALVLGRASAAAGDAAGLAEAHGRLRTAIDHAGLDAAVAAAAAGDVDGARAWLLLREFRPPTRFSRAGADATLALDALADGRIAPPVAAAAVRTDLLDTYQARLRTALDDLAAAVGRGFWARAAGDAALARGYAGLLATAHAEQRGAQAQEALAAAFDDLLAATRAQDATAAAAAAGRIDQALEGFRAAPLSTGEQVRRAGQLLRFTALVPVEYGRGVDGGRVVHDFEIQEAITFRDGAAQAFADLESVLLARDAAGTRRIGTLLDVLGDALAAAAAGSRVVEPDVVDAAAAEVVDLAGGLYPEEWKDAGEAADFDVIQGALDRVEAAAAAGQHSQAEQARLEAYAFFEFGPEQRLRGLAPGLFVRVEGLFWYGEGDTPGLAQLLRRKASAAEVAVTRAALDAALGEAESAVGSGATSTATIVTNTAVIVFREGLEAVLIVAALVAGMAGARQRFRRPLVGGVAAALAATVVTWVIAQTVLGSLSRYGERLEAVVSLVAIGVLLLIMNWFYHKVYWTDRLAGFQGRKKALVGAGLVGAATAQALGLVALGFTSVYREGFETVLFLQALSLEAGPGRVLLGVAVGLAGVGSVAVLVFLLHRRLPHKKMLITTGFLLLAVLVIMVGKTVQVLQSVGWLPVDPVEGLRLPYWAGQWFGTFPTWEGLGAQALALALVVGSYLAAEGLRARRRRRILAAPIGATARGDA